MISAFNRTRPLNRFSLLQNTWPEVELFLRQKRTNPKSCDGCSKDNCCFKRQGPEIEIAASEKRARARSRTHQASQTTTGPRNQSSRQTNQSSKDNHTWFSALPFQFSSRWSSSGNIDCIDQCISNGVVRGTCHGNRNGIGECNTTVNIVIHMKEMKSS